MSLYKKIISVVLCVIFILSLTACNNTDQAYIYFNLTEKPNTLDPQTAKTDTELLIIRNIFEGLMRKDKNGKTVCAVAEKYKKEGLTYIFYLKDNLTWSDQSNITAHDFVFAFKRAVDPKTKAPYAERLSSIKNAPDIIKGEAKLNSLGIEATDNYTLKITLSKEDDSFLETLTTSIAMPCKESFFNSTSGKYGLDTDKTLSNGSYRLAKWGKDIFGIRLYRNDYYKGDFKAENSAVFFSIDNERDSLSVLKDNDADIAFIQPSKSIEAENSGFKTVSYNNTAWFLTESDGFSKDIRKAFISLSNPQLFGNDLIKGYYTPKSIYPGIISDDTIPEGLTAYDLENAKEIFSKAVNNLTDKKFPDNVVLYYYDDGTSKNIVTDIVGHWQSQLSAFINIESVSSPELLTNQLKEQTYALAIFPIVANSPSKAEYLKNFGISYSDQSLSNIQAKLLESKNITPLFTQDTVFAYNKTLSNLRLDSGNGCIDFAYIIKKE